MPTPSSHKNAANKAPANPSPRIGCSTLAPAVEVVDAVPELPEDVLGPLADEDDVSEEDIEEPEVEDPLLVVPLAPTVLLLE